VSEWREREHAPNRRLDRGSVPWLIEDRLVVIGIEKRQR